MSDAVQAYSRTVELPIARVGHLHEPHDHPHPQAERVCAGDLIYLPYRGLFVCHVGVEEAVGDANQTVFLRAGESYRVHEPVGGGSSALTVAPRPDVVSEIADANDVGPGLRSFTRTRAACPRVQLLRARLLHRTARPSTTDEIEIEEIVLALLRCVLSRRQRPDSVIGAKTARLIRCAKEFLAVELSSPIRLDDVGRAVGTSPVYLTELFRRVEGLSLHQYLTRLRLARALVELPVADDLTALALEVGFSSHSHFSAVFRRVFGCTPSQCRAMLRNSSRRPARPAATHLLGVVASERRVAARDRLPLLFGPAQAVARDEVARRSRGWLFTSRVTQNPES